MNPTRPSSSRRTLRILLVVGICGLLVLLAGLVLLDRGLRGKYEPVLTQMRKDVTDQVDFFCEQQVVLGADPWFHEPRTEGNAGPLLNAWVGWEPAPAMPKDSPLAIPAHLPQRGSDFKDWTTSSLDLSALDFDWMRKLHAYDRWDILLNSPVPQQERFNWASAPLPNFLSLQMWAKFRLVHGLRTGQPLEAAQDVRHLAWLLYRTDSMLGTMVAATLLQFERDAHDAMQSPPPEWRPMSPEQVARFKALVASGHAFSSIVAPVEVAKKARRCGEPAVTRCMSMGEASYLARYLQPIAQDDYREAYTALRDDIAAFPCATSMARVAWERGATVDDSVPTPDMPEQPGWLRRLPRGYFNSHLAGILLGIGSPSFRHLNEFREKLASGAFNVGGAQMRTPSP
jgi:hypothetical protein